IAAAHELQPHAIVLVRPGGVPRTTSGKVRRQACKAAFLEGRLDALWETSSANEADEVAPEADDASGLSLDWARARVAALLGVPASAVDPDSRLTQLGLDSLQTLELSHALEERTGAVLPLERLLEGPTLAELCRALGAQQVRAAPTSAAAGSQVSFGQRSTWFLPQLAPSSAACYVAP